MRQNGFYKLYTKVKDLLIYKTPTEAPRFVLGEGTDDTWNKSASQPTNDLFEDQRRGLLALLSFSRRLEALTHKISHSLQAGEWQQVSSELKTEHDKLTKEFAELSPITLAYDSAMDDPAKLTVRVSLSENEAVLSRLFNLPDNKDVVIRKFALPSTPEVPAMAVFLEGLSDKKLINFMVLAPLMLLPKERATVHGKDLVETLLNTYIPGNQVKLAATYEEVASGINSGDTVVFVDGNVQAFVIETKGWEHRSVGRPEIEPSV
ncbi:MAG: gerAA 1, partial [Sporomusa sp.]|nr:gerAA 1 [Sporomusa sp.]